MNEMILRLAMAVNMLQGAYPVLDEELLEQRAFLRVAAPFVCQINDREKHFFTGNDNDVLRSQLDYSRLLAKVISTAPMPDDARAFGLNHEQIAKSIESNRNYRDLLSAEFGKGNMADWLQRAADENEHLHTQLQVLRLAIHPDSEERFKRECQFNLRNMMGAKAYYSRQPVPSVPVWSLKYLRRN